MTNVDWAERNTSAGLHQIWIANDSWNGCFDSGINCCPELGVDSNLALANPHFIVDCQGNIPVSICLAGV